MKPAWQNRRGRRPPKCKNPPRMAAGGFWADELTVTKTPHRTGPVNRKLRFLSTGSVEKTEIEIIDLDYADYH
jgi:hypothetical protein